MAQILLRMTRNHLLYWMGQKFKFDAAIKVQSIKKIYLVILPLYYGKSGKTKNKKGFDNIDAAIPYSFKALEIVEAL